MLFFRFRRLSLGDYKALVKRCQILEYDGFGEKVLQTPDDLIVKIFRRKRLLTSATIFPYASRFVRNSRRLTALGLATVTVLEHAYCAPLKRHLITYRPLPGITLRKTLQSSPADTEKLLDGAAIFVATLHQKGIYFRSLHFGNIIVLPSGAGFGLIDIADMKIHSGALTKRLRVRNFKQFLRCAEDAGCWQQYALSRFFERYLSAANVCDLTLADFVKLSGQAKVNH